jgi:hypothetical protein
MAVGSDQWPCDTSSDNSSKSKTNTKTGKTVEISKNPKFEKNQFNIKDVRNF